MTAGGCLRVGSAAAKSETPLAARSIVQLRRGHLARLAAQMRASGGSYRWDRTEDFRESVDAFLEHRDPVYKGR
jgi:enoyl-CoA hydratase/carnithine racemase